MAAELPNRCPNCGKAVEVGALAFSSALGAFVCAACRGESPTAAPQPTPRKWILPLLIGTAACILVAIIVFFARGPSLVEQQRAWDEAHHDQIITLKSEAEALAIQGKLAEAHAKYREIEKIIGGRQVKEPTLFDMVEVARQDQDKIYKILLSRMDHSPASAPPTVQSAPAPLGAAPSPAPLEPPAATAPITPLVNLPKIPPPASASTAPAATSPAADAQPTSQAAWSMGVPKGPVTDEQIGQAIQHGVDFLVAQFKDGQVSSPGTPEVCRQGIDALCVYALASSSKAISDERLGPKSAEMMQMLEKLKAYPLESGPGFQMPLTYARSLRACALATFNRLQDRNVLKDDVAWLVNAHTQGSYTYDDRFAPARKGAPAKKPPPPQPRPDQRGAIDGIVPLPQPEGSSDVSAPVVLVDGSFPARPPPPPPPPIVTPGALTPPNYRNTLSPANSGNKYRPNFPYDNSNSQYGLLGVWAGAEVGMEVPDSYWQAVERHWNNCQLPNGEWKYNEGNEPARFSMTCAGIASLLVTHDYLAVGHAGGRPGYSPALEAGLAWLEDRDNCVNIQKGRLFYVGYNLFGVERVGLASGLKQFGAYDWFLQLAFGALKAQNPDGSFGEPYELDTGAVVIDARSSQIINTAYVLLFLSRGRHPIIFNKLRYDGAWANRPRDVANLAGYTAKELERPLNWQVVDIRREPWDWADSPILFISGNKPIKFSAEEMAKLQTFVDNGGILFTHAEQNSEEFNKFIADFAKQLFPAYPLADLPIEHDLYKLSYNIATPRPRLQGVSNGVRLLLVHSPTDLTMAWQQRSYVTRREAFRLGANIYLYATGKEKFRNRLDTPLIPQPTDQPPHTIELARLHYQGNWDPEPGAWPRMARKFEWETGVRLGVTAVDMDELALDKFRVAHLTGTDAFIPNDKDLASLKAFVESGGTLLIDAAGGASAFADAKTTWLPKLLGTAKLEALPPTDSLFKHTLDGTVDVPPKTLRLYAMEKLGGGNRIESAKVGKGRVVFSALDITSGLLGTNTWGILGYLPEYGEAVVKNLVLLSANDSVK